MKLSTVKLLVPIVAVAIQANSASTVIPPYLDHMRIPVALIGTLISLARCLRLLHGCRSEWRTIISARGSWFLLAILAMGADELSL